MTRRRKKHHPEEVFAKLRDADAMLNAARIARAFSMAFVAVNAGRKVQRGAGVGRPVEKCSAQLCSGVGQENCGGAAISPYRERGTRSVCSDGDVD